MADAATQAGKTPPKERLIKVKMLRQENEGNFKRLGNMVRVVLSQAFQSRVAYLEGKIREEEGKLDNVRTDNGLQRQA
jgi:hypothetical protein